MLLSKNQRKRSNGNYSSYLDSDRDLVPMLEMIALLMGVSAVEISGYGGILMSFAPGSAQSECKESTRECRKIVKKTGR